MIYTDALQTLIMVVGAVILTVKGEGLRAGGQAGWAVAVASAQDPAAGTGWGGGLTMSSLG